LHRQTGAIGIIIVVFSKVKSGFLPKIIGLGRMNIQVDAARTVVLERPGLSRRDGAGRPGDHIMVGRAIGNVLGIGVAGRHQAIDVRRGGIPIERRERRINAGGLSEITVLQVDNPDRSDLLDGLRVGRLTDEKDGEGTEQSQGFPEHVGGW